MSETVHYRGVASKVEVPEGQTLIDVATGILKSRNKTIDSYYNDALECLCESYYKEFFFHSKTQTLYSIDNKEYDPDDEIIRAERKENGTIEYELRYYNGGAGFDECLEEAFDKL